MTQDNRHTSQRPRRDESPSKTVDPQRIGLPRGPVTRIELLVDALANARQHCNVLAPATTIDHMPPDHGVILQVIHMPPDRDRLNSKTRSDGTWLKVDGGALALHANALNSIAQAAEVSWKPEACRREDDGRQRDFWRWSMTCGRMTLSGRERWVTRSAEYDLREGSEERRRMSDNALTQARKFGARRCETLAASRALRVLLGIRAYRYAEAQRPFVIPVLRWLPDMTDPMVVRMVTAARLGIAREIFGPPPTAQPTPLQIEQLGPDEMDDWNAQEARAKAREPAAAPAAAPSSSRAYDERNPPPLDPEDYGWDGGGAW